MMQLKVANLAAGLARPALSAYGRSAGRKLGVLLATGAMLVVSTIAISGFLLWALWEYVRPLVGPVGAPLILAAAVTLFAMIIGLIAKYALRAQRTPPYRRPTLMTPEAMIEEVEGVVRKQKVPVLLAAALFGIFAGSQRH